jgi:hypothetical protein
MIIILWARVFTKVDMDVSHKNIVEQMDKIISIWMKDCSNESTYPM